MKIYNIPAKGSVTWLNIILLYQYYINYRITTLDKPV